MGNAPSGKSTDVGMCSQKCFGKKISICQNGQPASQISLYLSLQCKLSCRRQKLTSRRNGIILTWLELGQNSVSNLNFFFLLLEYNHSDRFWAFEDLGDWIFWTCDASPAQEKQRVPCYEDFGQTEGGETKASRTHSQWEEDSICHQLPLPCQFGVLLQGSSFNVYWDCTVCIIVMLLWPSGANAGLAWPRSRRIIFEFFLSHLTQPQRTYLQPAACGVQAACCRCSAGRCFFMYLTLQRYMNTAPCTSFVHVCGA